MPLQPDNIGGVLKLPASQTILFGQFSRVYVYVGGYYLGHVSGDPITIAPDADTADVIAGDGPQGTKPQSTVTTGVIYTLTMAFAADGVNIETLSLLSHYIQKQDNDNNHAGYLGSQIFIKKPTFPIKLVGINEELRLPSQRPEDCINLYEVELDVETLIQLNGGDAKTIPVTGMVRQKSFSAGERVTGGPGAAAGYFGTAQNAKVPAIVWPDFVPTFFESVVITSATTIVVTLTKAAKLKTATTNIVSFQTAEGAALGAPVSSSGIPTTSVAATTWTLTYAANSFTANSVFTATIAAGILASDSTNQTGVTIDNIELKATTTNSI